MPILLRKHILKRECAFNVLVKIKKMHQENNQIISLEKYIQSFRSVYKEYTRISLLILLLIFGVVFAITYILFNPSVNFFILVIIGIGIIIGLESFNNIDIIDKVEKRMHGSNLNEFKQLFRKVFHQQHMKNIKICVPIYIIIMGMLIYAYIAYYAEDVWFVYIFAIIGLFILLSIINPYSDEFFKIIEKEAEIKAKENNSFIN